MVSVLSPSCAKPVPAGMRYSALIPAPGRCCRRSRCSVYSQWPGTHGAAKQGDQRANGRFEGRKFGGGAALVAGGGFARAGRITRGRLVAAR